MKKLRILDGTVLALASAGEDFDGFEQVVVQGAWKGHWQGEFQITEAMIDQMADFGNSRKIATPFDYGHATIYDSGADAAGWIEPGDFEKRGKGKAASLWAKVTWTENARTKIAAKELRYKSPSIDFNTRDRKTGLSGGASLHSVALTNTPFLHELPDVRLNSLRPALDWDEATEDPMNEEQLKKLAALFGLDATATADQCLAAVASYVAGAESVITALGLDQEITMHDAAVKAAEVVIKAAQADAQAAEVSTLTARVQVIETKDKATEAERLVRKYQAERKVAADGTDHFKACLAHAEKDPTGFGAMMDACEPWVAGGAPALADPGAADRVVLDETQKAINAKLGLTDETFTKHNPAAL